MNFEIGFQLGNVTPIDHFVFNDVTVAESQDETALLGSLWIPFLNSSKDRSFESEAE